MSAMREAYVYTSDARYVHAGVVDHDTGIVVWQCDHRHKLNAWGQSVPAKRCAYAARRRFLAAFAAVRPDPTGDPGSPPSGAPEA
jgi:hypothetical protein